MAALDASLPTLADLVKQQDPDGAQARIVEMLTQRNNLMKTAVFKEGNLNTGERITSRTALPSVGAGLAWRMLNQGIGAGKSRTDQFDETCGMLSGFSKVDKALADLNGGSAYRMSEDMAFIQAMTKELESGFWYHSTLANPEKFHGFTPRLNATASNPAADQIVKHTGAPGGSDQTSIWFIVWGPDTVYGIFPKGSSGGLQHQDMGIELVNDANSNPFPAYRTWWDWKVGLAVRDWRFLARVCNIDTSALSETTDDLIPKMIDAYYAIEDWSMGRGAIYCNRRIQRALHKQARAAIGNSTLSLSMIEGKEIVSFMGIPIYVSDGITNTEAIVT